MCNYRFEESKPVIQTSYTYEENGVLYCTSATQKGVYWYVYALNNPLKYVDPSGQWYEDAYFDYDDYRNDPIVLNSVEISVSSNFDAFGNLWGMEYDMYGDIDTDYEVHGRIRTINDGINNLRIPNITPRQYNRLQKLFNRGGNGYSNYMNKLSAANGFYTFNAGSVNINYHPPGGIPFSAWSQIGTWSEGMPIQTIADGTVYVVSNSTGQYTDLTSKSLKVEFNAVFRQGQIGPYWSPVADMRGFEKLLGLYASSINPLSLPSPLSEVIPLPGALQTFQTPSMSEVSDNATAKYYERLLNYYRKYNIIR